MYLDVLVDAAAAAFEFCLSNHFVKLLLVRLRPAKVNF